MEKIAGWAMLAIAALIIVCGLVASVGAAVTFAVFFGSIALGAVIVCGLYLVNRS